MKKIISVITAIIMLISSSNINVIASYETEDDKGVTTFVEDMSDYGYTEFIVKRYDSSKTRGANNPSMTLSMITNEGDKYYFEKIGREMKVYENGEYLTSIQYGLGSMARTTIPISVKSLGFSAGTGFSNYYMSAYSDWVIEHYNSYVTSKVVALMMGAITGGISFYVIGMATAINEIAGQLSNAVDLYQIVTGDKALKATTIEYGSYHKDCNILAWYGIKGYTLKSALSSEIDTRTGTSFKANGKYTWNGNPNDMTQPSGCRTLDKTYPS